MDITKENGWSLVHCIKALCVFTLQRNEFVFNDGHLIKIQDFFRRTCNDFNAKLVEFYGECDYVKITIVYPPKVDISSLVRSLKAYSSRELAKEFNDLNIKDGNLWKRGYLATSVEGASVDLVEEYIQVHKKHRNKRSG